MIFPRGFTGYRGRNDDLVPEIDLAEFKSVCFAAARELDGRVASFEFADVTPNFHCATLEWDHELRRVSVLCNREYWIVGFCEPREGLCTHKYLDVPELAGAIARVSAWQILSRVQLEAVVDDAALASMHPVDRDVLVTARQKGSFTPARTVGDVLFHYWD